jgi:hypothetical protein
MIRGRRSRAHPRAENLNRLLKTLRVSNSTTTTTTTALIHGGVAIALPSTIKLATPTNSAEFE